MRRRTRPPRWAWPHLPRRVPASPSRRGGAGASCTAPVATAWPLVGPLINTIFFPCLLLAVHCQQQLQSTPGAELHQTANSSPEAWACTHLKGLAQSCKHVVEGGAVPKGMYDTLCPLRPWPFSDESRRRSDWRGAGWSCSTSQSQNFSICCRHFVHLQRAHSGARALSASPYCATPAAPDSCAPVLWGSHRCRPSPPNPLATHLS